MEIVEMRGGPWPMAVLFYRSDVDGMWVLKLSTRRIDVDDGEPGFFGVEWRFSQRPTPKTLAVRTRDMIVGWLTHEVEEAIHVDGVRVLDPHKRERVIESPGGRGKRAR